MINPDDQLSFDDAEELGLDGTGRDGDPRFPFTLQSLASYRDTVQDALQHEWDEVWDIFVDRHTALCSELVHLPSNLVGNLEDCPALDEDPMGNFGYGALLSLQEVARRVGVPLRGLRQPELVH